jgi:hypothetical protein
MPMPSRGELTESRMPLQLPLPLHRDRCMALVRVWCVVCGVWCVG